MMGSIDMDIVMHNEPPYAILFTHGLCPTTTITTTTHHHQITTTTTTTTRVSATHTRTQLHTRRNEVPEFESLR
eukprot:6876090-Prorocentrum_lima.AAC.1